MPILRLIRWLDEKRREGKDRRPRISQIPLPHIEQFERRFCLGTVAAAAISEWSSGLVEPAQGDEHVLTERLAEEQWPVAPTRSIALEALACAEEAAPRHESVDAAPYNPQSKLPSLISSKIGSPLNPSGETPSELSSAVGHGSSDASLSPKTSGVQRTVSDDASSSASSAPPAAVAADYSLTSNGSAGFDAESASALASMNQDEEETPQLSSLMTLAVSELTAAEVETLLSRAAGATSSEDAIIAVVDRNGRILGVRAEGDVLANIPDMETLVFAIDGAVAKARTAALFSNNAAPLTSRTVRFISQSTVTEREVESNPNVDNTSAATAAASTVRGPGFVAPIGVGGHFPPEILNTPLVDLFGIEHTNRDSNDHPGPDGVKGTADDLVMRTNADGTGRFNINPAFVPAGQGLFAPESYGALQNSGLMPDAQSRGIATLPGGIPLFRDTNGDGFGDGLVGGIGVFFPGEDGFATHEQGFVPGIGQTEAQRTNALKVLEAEFIALAAAGGSRAAALVADPRADDAPGAFDLPFPRLDLVGITLEGIGPQAGNCGGVTTVLDVGAALGPGDPNSGADQPLLDSVDGFHRDGLPVPDGYLVTPHASTDGGLTAADVDAIIQRGILAAEQTRAAIRAPLGTRTQMVFAVTDTNGEVLGLYRMPDATTFSIDVAVAKARNVAYYADAADLQGVDQVPGIGAGTAFTNRTFRFLAQPRFPSGIDGTAPPEFSILNDDSINDLTAENEGAPAPVSAFDSVLGHDAFFPMTNFRDPGDAGVVAAAGADQRTANQNGIVFFPGSTPLYINGRMVGGFGVSGDGVDQDDVVTFLGAQNYLPDASITRADQAFYQSVRLPYQKFLRNPFG